MHYGKYLDQKIFTFVRDLYLSLRANLLQLLRLVCKFAVSVAVSTGNYV